MVSLAEVTEDNYLAVCRLEVTEEQSGFVAAPSRILASAYAMRDRNARVWAILADETIVGVAMVKDLFEEPACYTIEQLLVDRRFQNMGYGSTALRQVIALLAAERRFEAIEICVKMEDIYAVRMYLDAGFFDTGYIDPAAPDSYCIRYEFG